MDPDKIPILPCSQDILGKHDVRASTTLHKKQEILRLQMWAEKPVGMEEKRIVPAGGYPEERREIENSMFSGMMSGIISTTRSSSA